MFLNLHIIFQLSNGPYQTSLLYITKVAIFSLKFKIKQAHLIGEDAELLLTRGLLHSTIQTIY
jgi:hypothetical protein